MAEIKKIEKNQPKYPIAAKIGAAALAVGVMAGCMTGCGESVALAGDVQVNDPSSEYLQLEGETSVSVESDTDISPADITE